MPWARPPCTCPSTSAGFSTRPQSSTAMWRSQAHGAGLGVDLDHGDVRAEGERRTWFAVDALCAQARPESVLGKGGVERGLGELTERQPATGHTSQRESPSGSGFDVDRVGFEQMRREHMRLLEHLGGALHDRRATRLQRPRAPRARPSLHDPGVGVHDPNRPRTAIPSTDEASCAKAVSCPCPWGDVPVSTVTEPSACTSTEANSFEENDVIST